jgi:hypothetical protein
LLKSAAIQRANVAISVELVILSNLDSEFWIWSTKLPGIKTLPVCSRTKDKLYYGIFYSLWLFLGEFFAESRQIGNRFVVALKRNS